MSISVVHAFHKHENKICNAKNESHFHSKSTDCDQLHYFSQSLSGKQNLFEEFLFDKIIIQNQFYSDFTLKNSYPNTYEGRGPPIITVF